VPAACNTGRVLSLQPALDGDTELMRIAIRTKLVASLLLLPCAMIPAVLAADVPAQPDTPASEAKPAATTAAANPLLAPWSGPYGGVPPFDRIEPALFPAALEAALAERRAEIATIKANPEKPTFANTIEALERAGATYARVASVYGTWASSLKDEAFQKVEREWSPKLAAAGDEILLDGALFARIQAVWDSPERQQLSPEQQRLLWRVHNNFSRLGAKLGAKEKERLAAINQQLATLYTEFGQKVLKDEDSWIVLDSQADLAGLPEAVVAGLKAAADERQLAGKWVVVNTRSMVDPFLTYSSRRDLRATVWKAFKSRGDNGNENDTNATIAKIMPLRAEKAHLLGYPNYAAWKLSNTMAATPERARALMETVWQPTVARVEEEVADLQAVARQEAPGITIEPWDYLYYAEKVRKAKYDVDQNELKPYFNLESMIEASLFMANKVYGLTLTEVTGKVPVFHPDVRVWEVKDERGKVIGLFYGDYFARPGKGSGAWENAYRQQGRFPRQIVPLVSNNNNFVKGKPGEKVLISLDDAETLFHEFGHALHDLLSSVTYQSLAGTNTATDFVEFPSQVHENWVLQPEVLDRYARHAESGAPMPKALVAKVERSRTFNQGYQTAEYLAAAIVDMDLHSLPDGKVDPDAFERQDLQRIGMPKEVAMRHRLPQFNHLFTSEGYAAGYYSYLWSDTMAADAWAAFEETGDLWNPAVAAKLEKLLAAGDSIDQAELYRQFRGRDPEVAALLKQRGFPVPALPAAVASPAKN
jgi:peptidyl-dipeptidase Dcp